MPSSGPGSSNTKVDKHGLRPAFPELRIGRRTKVPSWHLLVLASQDQPLHSGLIKSLCSEVLAGCESQLCNLHTVQVQAICLNALCLGFPICSSETDAHFPLRMLTVLSTGAGTWLPWMPEELNTQITLVIRTSGLPCWLGG